MNKFIIGVVSFAGLIGAGVATSFYAGAQLEQEALKQVQALNTEGSIRIADFEHHRTAFSSEGKFRLLLGNRCATEKIEGDGMLVEYKATHFFPHFNGPMTIDATVKLPASVMEFMELASGNDVLVRMQVMPTWFGSTKVVADSTAFKIPFGSNSGLTVSGSQGHFNGTSKTGSYDWVLPSVDLFGPKATGSIKSISMNGKSGDLTKEGQKSTAQFGFLEASFDGGKLSGFSAKTDLSRHEGMIDANVSYKLDQLDHPILKVSKASVDFGLKGADALALERLGKVIQDSCGLLSMDSAAKAAVQQAVQQMIARGLTQTTKIGMGLDQGKVDATLEIHLQKPQGQAADAIRLADILGMKGSASAAVGLADKMGLSDLLAEGFASQSGDRVSTHFEYRAHNLIVNGKSTQGTSIGMVSAGIEAALDSLQESMDSGMK